MAKVSISAIKQAFGWSDPRGIYKNPERFFHPYYVEAYNSHDKMDVCYAIRELGTNQLVAKDLTKEEADAMMKILPQEIE
jgi:hypothetical protein